MKSTRLYARSVELNRRFAKNVSTVVCVLGNISARLASCLMMIHLRSNITVMGVEFVELGDVRTFSTAISVVAAIQFF